MTVKTDEKRKKEIRKVVTKQNIEGGHLKNCISVESMKSANKNWENVITI